MKINWKQKLSSRKFWFAILAFVCASIMFFGGDSETIEKIIGCIIQAAVSISYIFAEAMTDKSKGGGNNGS